MIEFKETTTRIIDCLSSDSYDEINELFDHRQSIIDNIGQLQFNKQEFIDICDNLNISYINKKLFELLKEKEILTREALKKISLNKSINKQYIQEGYVDSIYFNKKI